MQTIHAVFEGGVFRPKEPVDLPENTEVEFEPRPLLEAKPVPSLDEVYRILSKRYDSGQHDTAARHNEHQP